MCHKNGVADHPRPRRAPPPLDDERLRELAFAYVARFATSEAKLAGYLRRKLRERGSSEERPPDVEGAVARCVELGFVDDTSFAEQKAAALGRRGYGARRVKQALAVAGIAEDTITSVLPDDDGALEAARRFAQRKRIGRYAAAPASPELQQKQIAVMLRAGHGLAHARAIVQGRDIEEEHG